MKQSIGLHSLPLWGRVRGGAHGVSIDANTSTARRPHPSPLPEGEGEGARRRTPLLILAAGIALAFVPQLGLPAFYDSLLYLMLHWVVLATSWNILSGYSGYFS